MITPNIQPEKAWQMVIDQLRQEMSRANFDTWVRDTKFVSYENGVLTIGTANSYGCEWLASRLTGIVTHTLSGLLSQSVSVQFIVHEESVTSIDEMVEEESGREEDPESNQIAEVLSLQAEYQSVYDEIVQPDQVIVVPGYFLRFIPLLGPELSWLYIGFRQAAYEAGASKKPGKKVGAPAKKVAWFAGMSPRSFWRWAAKPSTWKQLRWLVKPIEDKPRWSRGSDGRPHQSIRYYRVAMTMPLTPFDEQSLRGWLYRKLAEGKSPLAILQAALETSVDELFPWPEKMPYLEDISGDPHSIQDVVKEVCTSIAESDQAQFKELVEKLAQHLMPSKDLVFLTHYFVGHWLARLGPGPGWFVTLMRDRCYLNQRTGEIRDEVRLEQGYVEAARWMGLKRVKTIWEWLRNDEVATFMLETGRENGTWEDAPRRIKVCLGEPMIDEDQDRANLTLAKWTVGASVSHRTATEADPIGASVSHSEANRKAAIGASGTHRNDPQSPDIGASDSHSGASVSHSGAVGNPIGASCTDIGAIDEAVGASCTDVGASGDPIGASCTDVGATGTDIGASVSHRETDIGASVSHRETDIGASGTPIGASVTDIGATDSHRRGASGTIDWRDWHSLNSLTPGFKLFKNNQTTSSAEIKLISDGESSERKMGVVAGEWKLPDLLSLNRISAKNQELLLDKGVSAKAFISWLLYSASNGGIGIRDPIGHAVSRLIQNPAQGAGGACDRLAALPANKLADLIFQELDFQNPSNVDWRTAMEGVSHIRIRVLADQLGVPVPNSKDG